MVARIADRTQCFAHTVDGNHIACDLGCALNIVGGTARNVAKDDLFRRSAAEKHRNIFFEFVFINAVFILNRGIERITKRSAARDNGDLTNGVLCGKAICKDRMTCLMICGLEFFLGFDLMVALLLTNGDLDERFLDIDHADKGFILSRRKKCRFVEKVCKVCTCKANGGLRDLRKIYVAFQRLAAGMDLEDLFSALDIGITNGNLSVKTTGTKERRVKDIGAVGRRDDDNAVMTAEAVHFDEKLIERLFLFVMTAAKTCTAASAHSIDLIDEDDACRRFLCRFKKIAYTGSTDTDVHFHKVGTRNGKERNVCFACNGFGKESFTRSGRAYEKYAARNLCAKLAEFGGILEVIDDLAELFLFLVSTGNIGEEHTILILRGHFYARLAEGVHSALAAIHAVHNKEPNRNHGDQHDKIREQRNKPRGLLERFQIAIFDI